MKTKTFFTITALILMVNAYGQKPTIELTFTAINSTTYVQLDSIKVMNRTQGTDTVLYWPDTVLTLYYVSITEIDNQYKVFQVFQNYPNPVKDQTTISLYVPDKDKVRLIISDMLGRTIIKTERILDQGYHSFRFMPCGGDLFFFIAQWRENSSSIKILHTGSNVNQAESMEYMDSEPISPQLKASKDIQSFFFSFGDELLYVGYYNSLQSGILDAPVSSETYTFQYATNIPCSGTPTVTYAGQVYNTIQIFSQCWLKENLNVGTMIQGTQNMSNNSVLEKYCYYNEQDSCAKYGALYQWDEMMQYTTLQGTQGICPSGWHIPTDEEWKVLEGAVDSQYGIGDPEWDDWDPRGSDAGTNLKSTNSWYSGGNGTDLFGFSGLPGGGHNFNGSFSYIGYGGGWWTSTEYNTNYSWDRDLDYSNSQVDRDDTYKVDGHSVRCIKDYCEP